MSYLRERVTLINHSDVTALIAMGAVNVALDVMREPADTTHHSARVQLATQVLGDPLRQGQRLAAVVLADRNLIESIKQASLGDFGALLPEVVDDAVTARLLDTWNALAGIAEPTDTDTDTEGDADTEGGTTS